MEGSQYMYRSWLRVVEMIFGWIGEVILVGGGIVEMIVDKYWKF